jgi:hypothetical protein
VDVLVQKRICRWRANRSKSGKFSQIMVLGEEMAVGTELQTGSRTGFKRTGTRLGRGQGGLDRVAGERGLHAE